MYFFCCREIISNAAYWHCVRETIREKENPEWRIDSGGWDPQMKKEREPGPPLLRGICMHLFNLILPLILKGKKEQVHANRTGQKSPIQRGTFLRLGCGESILCCSQFIYILNIC